MAFFAVAAQHENKSMINGNSVSKVVDFGTYRAIYQDSDTQNDQVKDTLSSILDNLRK